MAFFQFLFYAETKLGWIILGRKSQSLFSGKSFYSANPAVVVKRSISLFLSLHSQFSHIGKLNVCYSKLSKLISKNEFPKASSVLENWAWIIEQQARLCGSLNYWNNLGALVEQTVSSNSYFSMKPLTSMCIALRIIVDKFSHLNFKITTIFIQKSSEMNQIVYFNLSQYFLKCFCCDNLYSMYIKISLIHQKIEWV